MYRPAPPTLFRVDEAKARIRALVSGAFEAVAFERCLPLVGVHDPLRELKARSAVASNLLEVLRLERGSELVATQAEPWATILVKAAG